MVARRHVMFRAKHQSLHEAAANGDLPNLLDLLKRSLDEEDTNVKGGSVSSEKAIPNDYVYATVKKDRPMSVTICVDRKKEPITKQQSADATVAMAARQKRRGESLKLRRKATIKARARVKRNKSKYNLEGDGNTTLLHHETPNEDMALFDAVREGMPLAVQTLLMTGKGQIKIDNADHEGLTPLMRAAINDQVECMRLLLDFGANVDVMTSLGCTALHFAASQGGIECVEMLLDAGATIDPETKYGATPLMLAAKEGQADCLRILLERGANVHNVYTNQGARSNALLFATEVGHYDCVKLLLDYRIDVNQPNALGVSALMRAVQHHNNECVTLLIDNHARLSANDGRGRTALHYAVEYDNVTAVKMLLRSGADVRIETQGGSTPLTYAQRTRNNKCIEVIERHMRRQESEKENSKDKNSKTQDETITTRLLGCLRKCGRSLNCFDSC